MGFQLPFPQLVIFAPLLGKLRPAFWWNLRPLPVWNREKNLPYISRYIPLALALLSNKFHILELGNLKKHLLKNMHQNPPKICRVNNFPNFLVTTSLEPLELGTGRNPPFPTFQVTRLSMQGDPSTSRASICHLQILALVVGVGGWVVSQRAKVKMMILR